MSNPAVDEAVNRLRAEILAGDFGIGCLPYRKDMARRYGTSVYAVDQAIRQLLDEGLLILKKKRVFVAGTSWQAPIQASRIALEQSKQTIWEVLRPSSRRPELSINQYTINAIKQIWKQGRLVVKRIIFESEDEREAFAHERRALKQFASPCLTNHQQNPFVNKRILHRPDD